MFRRSTTAALDDLRDRLLRFRSIPRADVAGTGGFDPELLDDLVDHWTTGFDWRIHEDLGSAPSTRGRRSLTAEEWVAATGPT